MTAPSSRTLADLKAPELATVYGQTLDGIWETDGISFKLLGLVPVVSAGGAAALVGLLESDLLGPLSIGFLSVLGAITTFAVYRWELRNTQTCDRLWERAKAIEACLGFRELADRKPAPPLFGVEIGKKRAERAIYAASLAAWLLPLGTAISTALR